MRQKEKDKKRNRRLFLRAAEDLFADKGFLGTSIGEISKKAGFSKGAIYNYFNSKEEVILELIDFEFNQYAEGIDLFQDDSITLRKKISRLVEYNLQFFTERESFFRIVMPKLFQFVKGLNDPIVKKIREKMLSVRSKIVELIMKNRNEVNSDYESEELADLIMSVQHNYIRRKIVHKTEGQTIETTTRHIMNLFDNGIFT